MDNGASQKKSSKREGVLKVMCLKGFDIKAAFGEFGKADSFVLARVGEQVRPLLI